MQPKGAMTRQERGKWGEKMAEEHLIAQGYAILERNWKMGHYEVDLIAQKDAHIIFVEVKTRENPANDPIDAVNARKRQRIIVSADVFMRKYNIPYEYRFDIVAVTGNPGKFEIEHIPDAFMPSLKRFNYTFRL